MNKFCEKYRYAEKCLILLVQTMVEMITEEDLLPIIELDESFYGVNIGRWTGLPYEKRIEIAQVVKCIDRVIRILEPDIEYMSLAFRFRECEVSEVEQILIAINDETHCYKREEIL